MSRKLTDKEAAFVREYLVDLNASRACLRAGYQTKNPNDVGCRLLQRGPVAEAVQAAVRERDRRVEVKADDVLHELKRLSEIETADWRSLLNEDGTVKRPWEWPEDVARRVSSFEVEEITAGGVSVGVIKKIKFWNKNDALGLLAKHKGLVKDRVSHENPDGTALSPATFVIRPVTVCKHCGKATA